MTAILKREISAFFTSPVAYLVIGLFLVLSSLFLWVFRGPFNVFDAGFADLSQFFLLAPWVLLLLIPAVTMKSFAEEKRLGTLELLYIKPISLGQVVTGKFLGAVILIALALIPTLVYAYTISELGTVQGNLDTGVLIGSYLGLLFLVFNYTAMGIFASTLTDNQIVAFILGLLLCFLFYYGFEGLASLFGDGQQVLLIRNLGMQARFSSVARGVLELGDLVYFLSGTILFLYLSVLRLKIQSGR